MRTAAVDAGQVAVGVSVAVILSVDLQVVLQGGQGLLLVLGQGMTGSNSCIVQRIGVLDLINGHVQEIVGPGSAGFLVGDLIANGLVDIQQIADPTLIFVHIVVDGIDVEVVQFHCLQLVVANGDGVGISGQDSLNGSLQEQTGYDADAENNYYPEGQGIGFQLLSLFLLCLLTLSHCGSVLLLAQTLLIGCTHGINSSHICCWYCICIIPWHYNA